MRSERVLSGSLRRHEWEIRVYEGDPEYEFGFVKLALLSATGRTLGVEAGPALLVDYAEIRPRYRRLRRRPVLFLFSQVLRAAAEISEEFPIQGILFDPVAPSVERFCVNKLNLEKVGVPPTMYYLMPMTVVRIAWNAVMMGQAIGHDDQD